MVRVEFAWAQLQKYDVLLQKRNSMLLSTQDKAHYFLGGNRHYGEMSEWFKDLVLKTSGAYASVDSNPTLSANIEKADHQVSLFTFHALNRVILLLIGTQSPVIFAAQTKSYRYPKQISNPIL